ncbi:agamous-like MADS-box protein AGL61 [Argentina anserina]|uniref:agamous-like MADS-box protein AGL61 n=1 Tax=Argentina anserina TaxID=57926 RepID=UPI002176297B|nr:agamous-like MADS-box protein AGL61 [Potentilla anserina]
MGLKKIEIKKLTNKQSLKVTYCKRRNGLFRKADKYCSKTGAQIAIITFSPGMKPMTFGNPSVEAVVDRYELWERQNSNGGKEIMLDDDDHGLHEIGTSDEEDEVLEGMELNELKQYAKSVEEQRNFLAWQIEDRMRRESSTKDLLGMNNASVDLMLFGVKVGETVEIEEMEETRRRESRTADFLSNFN